MNKILIVLSAVSLMFMACGKTDKGSQQRSVKNERQAIIDAKIKSIKAVEYTYDDKGEVIDSTANVKKIFVFNEEGLYLREYDTKHGDSIAIDKLYTYVDNDSLPSEEKGYKHGEHVYTKIYTKNAPNVREEVMYGPEGEIISTSVYTTNGNIRQEIKYGGGDSTKIDYKKIWEYDDLGRLALFNEYDGFGGVANKTENSYDENGLKQSVTHDKYGVESDRYERVAIDKNKVEYKAYCSDGTTDKYNYTEITDDNGAIVQTIFEFNLIKDYQDKRFKYNDEGFKDEIITYNKEGKPVSILKYTYEKW